MNYAKPLAAALLLLATSLTPALAQDQAALIKPIDKKLTFIYVPKLIHPWYEAVQQGIAAAVAEAAKDGIEVEVVWDAPPVADVTDHNARIEANIGRHPDGLAVSCLDPVTNTSVLKEAVGAGINLITFDTYCDKQFHFVGDVDATVVGYQVGQAMVEKLGGKGKVAILAGSLTGASHVGRIEGFKKAIADHPGIEVVFEQPDNDDLETAVTLTENALLAHPDLNAIFANNASNPIGAARAVKNAGKSGEVLVFGTNTLAETLPYIEDGTVYIAAADRQWEMGYWTIKYLIAMNQGHTVPMEHVTGVTLLKKEDLAK